MWDHLGWLRKQTQVVYLGVWEAESAGKEGGKVGRSQAREAVYAPEAQTSLLRTWVRSHVLQPSHPCSVLWILWALMLLRPQRGLDQSLCPWH